MGKIVGGFLMPHNPLIFQSSRGVDSDQRDRVMDAYTEIGKRIGVLGATTAIIVGTDHYVLFGPGCLPSILIAVGDLDGPLERLEGMKRGPIPNNPALAEHVMSTGFSDGFDWTVAKAMTIDHSTAIPYHMCVRQHPEMSILPIYLACGVDPLLNINRASALGASLRHAVETGPDEERVVIIGSGGISHWVGEAQMGRVNEQFDREILGMVQNGDVGALCDLSDEYVIENGGNGALEIRNFVCAMSAVDAENGKIIAYEPVPGWITGLGFVELFGPEAQ